MTLKEKILKRKSVRLYGAENLSVGVLNELNAFTRGIKPPFDGAFSFKIIDKAEYDATTGGLFKVAAPHYIMFYGEKTPETLKNIGFVGELFCLECAGRGIGTCWLGGTTCRETENALPYTVCVAFGPARDTDFRTGGEKDFKRKKLSALARGYGAKSRDALDMARLAPSAVNYQPWFFDADDNKIRVYRNPKRFLKIPGVDVMQKIDIGIALSHFTVRKFEVVNENLPELGRKIYECTVILG